MRNFGISLFVFGLSLSGVFGAPPTVNVQGTLEAPGGGPLVGSYDYRIGYYDQEVGGTELAVVTGTVVTSQSGRFSIGIAFPTSLLAEENIWYGLAIDTEGDGFQGSDFFDDRAQVHSVPFALLSENGDNLGGTPAANFALGAELSFSTQGNVTSNSPGDLANDDFVFGCDQLDDDGDASHQRRFFFGKSKGAFRAGQVEGIQWDATNVGPNSVAFGSDTTASGVYALAAGRLSKATTSTSTAFGYSTTASGVSSTAMGRGIEAGGSNTVAIGLDDQEGTVVSRNNVMAIMGGDVGIGSVTPPTRLRVEDNVSGFVATVVNEGDNANRGGIKVTAGADDGAGTTDYLLAEDGDGNSVGALRNFGGTFQVVGLSDVKSKTNNRDTEVNALAIIEGLRVVDFNRNTMPDGPTIHGFIAQEAQEVFPEMVSHLDENYLGVSTGTLIPILTKAIQDQQAEIAELRGIIEERFSTD